MIGYSTLCQLYISNYSINDRAFVCYPNVLATHAPFVIILIHTLDQPIHFPLNLQRVVAATASFDIVASPLS